MEPRLTHSVLRGDVPFEYERQGSDPKCILDGNRPAEDTSSGGSVLV